MGLLSFLRELVDGGGTEEDKLMHQELEQVRALAEAAERGDTTVGNTSIGPKVRRRYRFVGSVQGVGFRWTTTNLARSVGATGWVTNELDGSVVAEIQGIREQVDAVIEGLDRYYNGSKWLGGFVIDEARDIPIEQEEYSFEPLY